VAKKEAVVGHWGKMASSMDIVTKLLLAALFGGLIGLERESHGRPAGLRTNILVCVGATLIMVVARSVGSGVVDPGRAIAGVVTGIGFLGAGAIIKMGNIVRGLTTAASIWLVAVVGIAVGEGLYGVAAGTTALALFVLVVVDRLSQAIPAVSYHTVRVSAPEGELTELEEACRRVLEEHGLRVLATEVRAEGRAWELSFHVRARGIPPVIQVVRDLGQIRGVARASWEDFRG